MKENKLLDLSRNFAVKIIKTSNQLKLIKEHSIADQLKRSGTSIAANIAEGNHPQSVQDMISKFEIALKEANEVETWLDIINKSNLLSEFDFNSLNNELIKIKILLINSIKTLKFRK